MKIELQENKKPDANLVFQMKNRNIQLNCPTNITKKKKRKKMEAITENLCRFSLKSPKENVCEKKKEQNSNTQL